MHSTQRAHILIPADLLREIDAIVGPRGRSAFLLETAREEVRRRKLLRFLESDEAAWREREHPELGKGSAEWVRNLRAESEGRVTGAKTRRTKVRREGSGQSKAGRLKSR
jgi:hypothetical protein